MNILNSIVHKEVIWILAGSYAQYLHYMHKLRDSIYKAGMDDRVEFKYLSNGQKIRGHRGEYFICVGTWDRIRREVLDEILILTNHLKFQEIRYCEEVPILPMDMFMPWEEKFEFLSEQEMRI